jgi:hypothetical protein
MAKQKKPTRTFGKLRIGDQFTRTYDKSVFVKTPLAYEPVSLKRGGPIQLNVNNAFGLTGSCKGMMVLFQADDWICPTH